MVHQTNPAKSQRGQARAQVEAKRAHFYETRRTERMYAAQLRKVARHVGSIVDALAPQGIVDNINVLLASLEKYAEALTPWAKAMGARMVADVNRRDLRAWRQTSREMGLQLQVEINTAPTGFALKSLLDEQVELITSIPREAGQRVHELTTEAVTTGRRASEIAKEIQRTTQVTENRAKLIARTEVARTASGLTMSRAVSVGTEGYIWRTSKDSDVRESHKEMEGKFIRWDEVPTLSDGTKTHAGMIYNCRCWMEPVITD